MREEYHWNNEKGKYVKVDEDVSNGEWDEFVSWCERRWIGWIPDRKSIEIWEGWRGENE